MKKNERLAAMKRTLVMFLAVLMLLCLIPASVFADTAEEPDEVHETADAEPYRSDQRQRRRYGEQRYEEVAEQLENMTGIKCSYTAISKDCDEESGYKSGKKDDPAEDFSFETSFFSGRRVILIDDVITRGNTLNCTARRLTKNGALDVIGLTVARTYNPIFQHSDADKQLVCA